MACCENLFVKALILTRLSVLYGGAVINMDIRIYYSKMYLTGIVRNQSLPKKVKIEARKSQKVINKQIKKIQQ